MAGTYRDRAKEADALAARAYSPRERKAFEEIAAIWRRLAEGEAAKTWLSAS